MHKILIIGPQGSGKGTQAERLSKHLGIPTMSMGQLFRDEIAVGSEIGKRFAEIQATGNLMSDLDALQALKNRLQRPDASNGYIIDGYPRNIAQYNAYIGFDKPTHVVVIKLSDDEAIMRLSGRRTCKQCAKVYHLNFAPPKQQNVCDVCGDQLIQREDETDVALRRRLDIYRSETEPMLKKFEEMGLLCRVDGKGSIDEVELLIHKALNF